MNDLLKKRFPKSQFNFHKFYETTAAKTIKKLRPSGVIVELKSFSKASLKLFDRFMKDFRDIPQILILSPAGFQILNQKRKDKLHQAMIAISETTSLDYLIQLPRMVEEAGRKRLLRYQNERLQRLLQNHTPTAGFGPNPSTEVTANRKALSDIMNSDSIESKPSHCGLKIHLKNWRRISRQLGDIAQNEIVEVISRMINQSVRNSDRVLRSREDEFTIFLAHTDVSNLNRCKDRIEQTLTELRISSNDRELEIPISISSVEQLSL